MSTNSKQRRPSLPFRGPEPCRHTRWHFKCSCLLFSRLSCVECGRLGGGALEAVEGVEGVLGDALGQAAGE